MIKLIEGSPTLHDAIHRFDPRVTKLPNQMFIKLLLLKNDTGLKNNIFRELPLYLKCYTIRMAQVVKLNKELFVYVHHLRNHYTKQSCIWLQ